MSAAEGGRTGRKRIGGEAAPSERQPEDEEPVDQAEAEPSVTEGVYFSKVSGRDVWHAHDEQHDHIGTVYRAGERWHVKVNGDDVAANFGSASSGRAFLSGHHLGFEAGAQFVQGEVQRAVTMRENTIAELREQLRVATGGTQGDPEVLAERRAATQGVAPGRVKDRSTDASHDADT